LKTLVHKLIMLQLLSTYHTITPEQAGLNYSNISGQNCSSLQFFPIYIFQVKPHLKKKLYRRHYLTNFAEIAKVKFFVIIFILSFENFYDFQVLTI